MASNPRRLFLIDGLGALTSVVLLGLVLVRLEYLFGMPREALYLLALFPVIFMSYDIYCYFNITGNPKMLLKIIAGANFIYCCMSIVFLFWHRNELTTLGWTYFLLEIFIVAVLIYIEWQTAAKLNQNSK